MFEIVLVAESYLIFDSSGARTDQNVPHQSIEPAPLEMKLSKWLCSLLKNDLLRVGLPSLPLSLHFLYPRLHQKLLFLAIFDFSDFLVQSIMQLSYVRLSTIDISLVVGLELEDFLFKFDVELVHVIQLAVFFV